MLQVNSSPAVKYAVLALMASLLVPGGYLRAQALYGSVVGTVTDATGGVVPGATVKATDIGTGQVLQTVASNTGAYSLPTLPPGAYNVTVSHQGFENYIQRGVDVTIGNVVRVDAQLKLGATTESVQVSAEAAELQTDKAEVRSEIATKEVEQLPVPVNRSYQNLLVMVPGVSPPATSSSPAANPARGEVFSVNGDTQGAASTRIEGANAINGWMSHETGYVPGLDAIQTVTVSSNSLDADQGLAGSASINVQLKSGTNQIHGSAFEFNQNNALEAKPFFLPVGQGNPKFIDNQTGGTFGGPIIKNKLFYFGSYDGQFIRQFASQIVSVPTAAIRSGDMSGSGTPIYDPMTGNANGTGRTAFAGNIIPQSRLDPIALRIQQLYPLPNLPGIANNYYATGDYLVNRHKFDGKINYNLTRKLTLVARLGMLDYHIFNPDMFGDNGNGVNSAATRDGNMDGTVFNGTVSGTYIVNPHIVIDSYFGLTRLDTSQVPVSATKGDLGLNLFGLPGTNGPGQGYAGYPSFSISSYQAFGKYADSPVYYYDPAYDYVANMSWVKGNHNIRLGVDIQKIDNNNWELSTNGGSFSFGTGPTQLNGGTSGNQYNSYATFLLGLTTGATNNFLEGGNRATSRMWADSLYVRDQWQATRTLTLSLGLRWEYLPFGTGANRGFETFNFQTNTMNLCGLGSTPRDCGVSVPKTDFSPRVGIAWRATPTLVVRTGFGINFDPNPLAWVRDFVGEAEIMQSATWPTPPSSYQYTSLLSQGIPAVAFPSIVNGTIPNYPLAQTFYVPPKVYHMGYIESWNFTMEKELTKGFLAQAGYVGDRQIKQLQALDQNAGEILGAGALGQPLYLAYGRTGGSYVFQNYGRNSYDSLQAQLMKTYSKGLTLKAAYTFSKALALCCDALSDKNPAVQALQYRNLNKAFWGSNRTNAFTMDGVYELPFGPGKPFVTHGVGSAIARGWQMQGIYVMYSGQPFSVSASGTSLNAPGNSQRANQVKPNVAMLGGTGLTESWFDPLAFAPVTTATFGTAGFNSIFGPGMINLDIGLSRTFQIRERWHLQFRADAFNATNTPHFSNPGANVSNLVLNGDGTIKSLGGFSTISSTNGGIGREGIDQRMLQVGVRLQF
ncbi:MAG TPA: TonB-dependent receptor [Bryobacteraceae bacterium]|nr:TonB-dependent receptor [Bryobacteraceae bacterium]